MNEFPDEVWVSEKLHGGFYVPDYPEEVEATDRQHYIHESKVPVSCGGTMEGNEDEIIARAHETKMFKAYVKAEKSLKRRNRAPETVGTGGGK